MIRIAKVLAFWVFRFFPLLWGKVRMAGNSAGTGSDPPSPCPSPTGGEGTCSRKDSYISGRSYLLGGIFGILLSLTANPAWAQGCNINVQDVNFGNYDVFNNVPLDSTGTITVNCTLAAVYSVSLSPGSGSYSPRVMRSGADTLEYNLYTNTSRTTIWGDGTGNTAIVSGIAAIGVNINHTVYGRIPARQNVRVGTYFDSITVTLSF